MRYFTHATHQDSSTRAEPPFVAAVVRTRRDEAKSLESQQVLESESQWAK